MKRLVLLNPGPVNVTPRVRRALLGPDICHRESEFRGLLIRTGKKVLTLFGIARTHKIAMLTGSGTCALEAMVAGFSDGRHKTLVLSNGVYGERIRSILERNRLPFIFLSAPTGSFPSQDRIEQVLRSNRQIHSIAMVHHETSTGMLNPLKKVTRLAKKYGKFLMVDAISSMGAEDIHFKGVDLCAGVSGKCLHGFPGISFVLCSLRAARQLKKFAKRSLYFDLDSAFENGQKGDTSFTPAVQILYALEAALDELKKEGLSVRIRRYREKSLLLQQGFEKLGIRFLLRKEARSNVLTALWTPAGISYDTLHARLKKDGFVIYSGQSSLKDRIFRVSHLGAVSKSDLRLFLKRFEAALKRRLR